MIHGFPCHHGGSKVHTCVIAQPGVCDCMDGWTWNGGYIMCSGCRMVDMSRVCDHTDRWMQNGGYVMCVTTRMGGCRMVDISCVVDAEYKCTTQSK